MTKKSKAICIIGMHRSGTSTVSRSINLLGAYLGEDTDFVTPLSDNPEGYWELSDIVNFHGRLLDQMKKSWDTAIPLPDKWHESEKVKPFRNELVGFIRDKFADHHLWAWKEPRLSLVLPIWKDALDELGIDFSTAFAIRNPLDVAKSLKKRDGFSYDKSFGIWFNYNINAWQNLSDLTYTFIHYDMLIHDWESELRRCSVALDIPWPKDDSHLRKEMNDFIRLDMRHSISTIKELKTANVPGPVIELYELLVKTMESSQHNKKINPDIERLASEFYSYARFFQFDMDRLWGSRQELAERDMQLIKKDQQIEALLTSYSWKVTKPLRWLVAIYKKAGGYDNIQSS